MSIPIETEYFLKVNKKINVVFGAALNLNLITGTNEDIITRVSVRDFSNNSKNIFTAFSNNHESINFSSEISIGIAYKAKFALIDLSFFRNNSITPDYTTGQYEFENINNVSNKTGSFLIQSNFYGLSLSVSPKKGWLKKKKR